MVGINKSKKIKWLLVIGLVLFLLTSFISCGGDIFDPKLQEEDPEEKPNEEDPTEGSGSSTTYITIGSETAIV